MTSQQSYCPYCNNKTCTNMTEEHVIPQSIGGDQRTVIKTCKKCNSKVGHGIDLLFSRDGWLRLNGLFTSGYAKRQDRLETTTELKDGRILEGYYYFVPTTHGYVPGFEPKKVQSDGSLWISEEVVINDSKLPSHINIFQRNMVKYWGFYCPPAKESGLEPAMIKVLLGIIYLDQGPNVIESKSFNILRYCLGGKLHSSITYQWLDKPPIWGNSKLQNHEHAVYFECPDGHNFQAGVALFGTAITFQVDEFGQYLPHRLVRWNGRPRS